MEKNEKTRPLRDLLAEIEKAVDACKPPRGYISPTRLMPLLDELERHHPLSAGVRRRGRELFEELFGKDGERLSDTESYGSLARQMTAAFELRRGASREGALRRDLALIAKSFAEPVAWVGERIGTLLVVFQEALRK